MIITSLNDELINNVIELLTNMKFLFKNEDKYELTKSGNIAANFYEISGLMAAYISFFISLKFRRC